MVRRRLNKFSWATLWDPEERARFGIKDDYWWMNDLDPQNKYLCYTVIFERAYGDRLVQDELHIDGALLERVPGDTAQSWLNGEFLRVGRQMDAMARDSARWTP